VHARRSGRRTAAVAAASLGLLLAGWNNLLVPRLPPDWYVPVNLAGAAALLGAARAAGVSWAELGLARSRVPAGLGWGGAAAAVVGAGYAVALAVPGLRPLLTDARAGGLGAGELAGEVLVRIPLGTVLWEEVAFRSVLLALLLRVLPPRRAVLVGATVFGVWHARPTASAVGANDLVEGPLPTAALVLAGCLVTAGAGLLFSWLRMRSGSLVAPVLLHLATNCLGLLAATAAHGLADG
jgi:uncharacterized protein